MLKRFSYYICTIRNTTMASKKVALKDIAREVGVSVTLVSFVLSGKEKEQRVGKEVARKIRQVAEAMNYRPNTLARSLRNGRTNTIGLVVADISNPFFAQLARAIETQAGKQGYSVIFANSNENEQQFRNIIDSLYNRNVDGFIIVPIENAYDTLKRMTEENIKFVLLDRYLPQLEISYVVADNYQAASRAARLLIEKGSTRPLMITYKNTLIHMQQRKQGFLDTVEAARLEAAVKEVRFSNLIDDMAGIVEQNLPGNYDGIFFATNTLSYNGLKQMLEKKKLQIGDIPVVSFDHNDAFDFITPTIPYLLQPIEQMGSEAVRILVESIEGNSEETVKRVLPVTLVEGRTPKPIIRP